MSTVSNRPLGTMRGGQAQGGLAEVVERRQLRFGLLAQDRGPGLIRQLSDGVVESVARQRVQSPDLILVVS